MLKGKDIVEKKKLPDGRVALRSDYCVLLW